MNALEAVGALIFALFLFSGWPVFCLARVRTSIAALFFTLVAFAVGVALADAAARINKPFGGLTGFLWLMLPHVVIFVQWLRKRLRRTRFTLPSNKPDDILPTSPELLDRMNRIKAGGEDFLPGSRPPKP